MLRILAITLLLCFNSFADAQDLSFAQIFSSDMVLQRNQPINFWGIGDPGSKLKITFLDKTYKTKVAVDGTWFQTVPAQPHGGPYQLILTSSNDEEIMLDNLLIGDVWVCSGQSNMEWLLKNSNNAEEEIRDADDFYIRHFKVPLSYADAPEQELAGGTWEVSDSTTSGNFTAVGYFFARELRKHVDVPIGLLNSSWGGSRIEPWMSARSLGVDDEKNAMEAIRIEADRKNQILLDGFRKSFPGITSEDIGLKDGNPLWASANLDEKDWISVEMPRHWEGVGFEGLDGIGWFRKTISLTAEEIKGGISIGVGKIDDSDITWVNGKQVGSTTQAYNEPRIYEVPSSYLKAGKNVVTIRVEDTGGGGGIHGEKGLMYLKTSTGTTSLAGDWKFKIGAFKSPGFSPNQTAMMLYNKMIHPMLRFPIKGALWYQGESNANNIPEAIEYNDLFPTMIKDWRNRWNVGDFPFLFVQLANFKEAVAQPGPSNWATIRESQNNTLTIPNTGQAVIIDIGEATDIHPRNKQDVGLRLSLAARKIAYGEDWLVASGPVYRRQVIENGKVTLEFDELGDGLKAGRGNSTLEGFTISGADGVFQNATAVIDDNRVIVSSSNVKNPRFVRYAWSDNPSKANLYNMEGLPASPFRTDNLDLRKEK